MKSVVLFILMVFQPYIWAASAAVTNLEFGISYYITKPAGMVLCLYSFIHFGRAFADSLKKSKLQQ